MTNRYLILIFYNQNCQLSGNKIEGREVYSCNGNYPERGELRIQDDRRKQDQQDWVHSVQVLPASLCPAHSTGKSVHARKMLSVCSQACIEGKV